MDRETAITLSLFKAFTFVLIKLLCPITHYLFQFRSCKIAEGGIFATLIGVRTIVISLFETVTQSLTEIRKLLGVRKGAKCCHDIFPAFQIGVVDDVP
jgi:hypothetical protein